MATLIYANVSPASIADNTIVAGVAGQRIRVVSIIMSASGGVNTATWKSNTAAIAPAMTLEANQIIVASGPRDVYLFQTASGAALNLALTAATLVGVSVVYVISDADS